MAAIPPICDFNKEAQDFKLMGVDEKIYEYKDIQGSNGTLIAVK